MNSTRGFTLIELLIAITIIGILSGIVLFAVGASRDRGDELAIKGDLIALAGKIEVAYNRAYNYSMVLDCHESSSQFAPEVSKLTNRGAVVRCYTYSNTGLKDVYQRFGAAALYKGKIWSVSPQGVVEWDAAMLSGTKTWAQATSDCAAAGKRLPTIEELMARQITPGASVPSRHLWSSVETATAGNSYLLRTSDDTIHNNAKTNVWNAFCVKA